jgi:hypothetical protein
MFSDTTGPDITIYILGDKEVNYPTYEVGELEPFKKFGVRMQKTVSQICKRPKKHVCWLLRKTLLLAS